MSIFLVDIVEQALTLAAERVKSIEGVAQVMGMKVDIRKVDEVLAMREKVLDVFGGVSPPIEPMISRYMADGGIGRGAYIPDPLPELQAN